jgi:hypothetical protein
MVQSFTDPNSITAAEGLSFEIEKMISGALNAIKDKSTVKRSNL